MSTHAEERSDEEKDLSPSLAETLLPPEDSPTSAGEASESPEVAEASPPAVEEVAALEGEAVNIDDEDEEKKKKKDTPEGLVWVALVNSKTVEKFRCVKALIPKELSITEIRRATCAKVGCPFKELQLQVWLVL
ncbi:unnamed protein product [Symbiodinium natans]|uniref:Uncharacterized protein n=1 Tax=Symbiodinium natans TaxID=878477 RepID=A0A812NS96_9DINO|nr:unnamed protein product [Symbiodinium natans]